MEKLKTINIYQHSLVKKIVSRSFYERISKNEDTGVWNNSIVGKMLDLHMADPSLISFILFWVELMYWDTLSSVQGLLLALYSGVAPIIVHGTM